MSQAQEKFNSLYVSSHEICTELEISRSSLLHARNRGMLPDAITIPGVNGFIWDRELIKPYLEAWKISLASRRGELV